MEKAILGLIIIVCVMFAYLLFFTGGQFYHVIDENGNVISLDEQEFKNLLEDKKLEKQRKAEKSEEKKRYAEISDNHFKLFD